MKLATAIGAFTPAMIMAGVGLLLIRSEQKVILPRGSRLFWRKLRDFFDEVTKLVVGNGIPRGM